MKDLNRDNKSLFRPNSSDALVRVQATLDFLWDERQRSMHDKVAGDCDYEELIGTLLCAEAALKEYEENTPEDE